MEKTLERKELNSLVNTAKKFTVDDFRCMVEAQHNFDLIQRLDGSSYVAADACIDLMRIFSVVCQVALRVQHEDFFSITEKEGKTLVTPTLLYTQYGHICNHPLDWLERKFPNGRLNPYVELFIKYFNLFQAAPKENIVGKDGRIERAILLNKMTRDIRKEASSISFKREVQQRCDKINKNARGLAKYIEELFEVYSKLMVLRVDLGFKKEHAKNITFESIRALIDEFLKNRGSAKNKEGVRIFESMVGYAVKIESGIEKGLHVHAMLFFNGARVRNDEWYATQVGSYWCVFRGNLITHSS